MTEQVDFKRAKSDAIASALFLASVIISGIQQTYCSREDTESEDGDESESTYYGTDPIPFALLRRQHSVALTRILNEKPHLLSAKDLLKAGFPLKRLVKEFGYTKSELLCLHRNSYRLLRSFPRQQDRITGIDAVGAEKFAAIYSDKNIQVLNAFTGECEKTWECYQNLNVFGTFFGNTPEPFDALLGFPDGTVVTAKDFCINRWNPAIHGRVERKRIASMIAFGNVCGLGKLSNDRIVSGSSKDIRIWKLTTGQCELVIDAPCASHAVFAELPDGSLAEANGKSRDIRLWDTRCDPSQPPPLTNIEPDKRLKGETDSVAWRCKKIFSGHHGHISSLVYVPAAKCLASSCDDKTIRLWPVPFTTASGKTSPRKLETEVLRGHAGAVTCLRVFTDALTLASGSTDGTIRLWDTLTGQCCSVIEAHDGAVACMTVLADGITVVSAGESDRSIKIWCF